MAFRNWLSGGSGSQRQTQNTSRSSKSSQHDRRDSDRTPESVYISRGHGRKSFPPDSESRSHPTNRRFTASPDPLESDRGPRTPPDTRRPHFDSEDRPRHSTWPPRRSHTQTHTTDPPSTPTPTRSGGHDRRRTDGSFHSSHLPHGDHKYPEADTLQSHEAYKEDKRPFPRQRRNSDIPISRPFERDSARRYPPTPSRGYTTAGREFSSDHERHTTRRSTSAHDRISRESPPRATRTQYHYPPRRSPESPHRHTPGRRGAIADTDEDATWGRDHRSRQPSAPKERDMEGESNDRDLEAGTLGQDHLDWRTKRKDWERYLNTSGIVKRT